MSQPPSNAGSAALRPLVCRPAGRLQRRRRAGPHVEVTRLVTQVVRGRARAGPPRRCHAGGRRTGAARRSERLSATLDPQRAGSAEEHALLQLMYEGLTRLDERLQPQPGRGRLVAVRGRADDRVQLRPGLTYADGAPLNALRFEYALHRALDPRVGGPHAAWLDDISGTGDWRTADPNAGAEDLVELAAGLSVRARRDRRRLRARARGLRPGRLPDAAHRARPPSAALLTILALPLAYPTRQESVEDLVAGAGWWQNSRLQRGGGPFVLATSSPTCARSSAQPELLAREAALGDLELVFRAPREPSRSIAPGPRHRAALGRRPERRARRRALRDHSGLSGRLHGGLLLRSPHAAFDDIGVRRAVAMALDRAEWARRSTRAWAGRPRPGSRRAAGQRPAQPGRSIRRPPASVGRGRLSEGAGLPGSSWLSGDRARQRRAS
jgi:hypothetical protein